MYFSTIEREKPPASSVLPSESVRHPSGSSLFLPGHFSLEFGPGTRKWTHMKEGWGGWFPQESWRDKDGHPSWRSSCSASSRSPGSLSPPGGRVRPGAQGSCSRSLSQQCQEPDSICLPQGLPFPPLGDAQWVGGTGRRPFWGHQAPDAHRGLGRCQTRSRGRGWGWQEGAQPVFPLRVFGIPLLDPPADWGVWRSGRVGAT